MRRLFFLACLGATAACVSPFATGRLPGAVLPEVPSTHGLPGGAYASSAIETAANLAFPPSATAKSHVAFAPATAGLNFNTGPLSYIAFTGMDVKDLAPLPGEARGESCATGIFLPIAAFAGLIGLQVPNLDISWGDGGYEAAVQKAFASGVTAVEDVRADTHVFSILGIFGQRCTVVHAKAYR